jgi:hypothetical protein
LSTFGFLHGGTMNINVTEFTYNKIGVGKDIMVKKKQIICFEILIDFICFFFSLDLVSIKQRIVVLLIIW